METNYREFEDMSFSELGKLLQSDIDDQIEAETFAKEEMGDHLPSFAIEADESFVEEIGRLKRKETYHDESKRIKEILILKESQIELVTPYLKSIGVGGFVYYEDSRTYKTIAGLRENLLNEPYWVISTLGKKGIVFPPKLDYNNDVIDKYINHVIITYNWKLLEKLNKENYTIDLNFDGNIYPYKVKFLSSLGDDLLIDFAMSKLTLIMKPIKAERICSYLMEDKKRLIENLNRFLSMVDYSFEDVVATISSENNVTYHINAVVKALATKSKRSDWKKSLAIIVNSYHPNYILRALRNNLEDLSKIKMGISVKSLSKNFLEVYADDVDMLNLVYLRHCLEGDKLYKVLLNLEIYMKHPTAELLKNNYDE